jgi:hypothetical protein
MISDRATEIETIIELHQTFPSLIPLNGKVPFEKGWERSCIEPRPFNPDDFKHHNAGIPGGPANGVIILDVDHVVKFNKMCKAKGWDLPETRVHLTGKGRPHYIFQYPGNGHAYGNTSVNDPEREIDPETGKVIKVFDIKGLGGQVVGPGSIHPDTGALYVVHNDLPIAPAPEWLLDLVKTDETQSPAPVVGARGGRTDIEALGVSYAIKKLIIEGEVKGRRSEAIMAVLNALVRAGQSDGQIIAIFEAHAIGEKYREAGHTRARWLLQQVAKVRAGVTPRADSKGAPTMAELREYIDYQIEPGVTFSADEICRALAAYKREHRVVVYNYLLRLVKEEILSRDPYKHGGYRKVLEISAYDMAGSIENKIFKVDLPLDLHKLLDIEPNHLISIAGSTDAGKSAFLFHVMKLNYREHRIIHLSSPEWSVDAIKKRMDEIGVERPHPNITCYPMTPGYEDLIPREPCIVLVDYLRTNEQFNELDRQYHAILRNLHGGIALTAIQKHIGNDKPTGGQYAIHAAHHVILLDTWEALFVCKILKSKNERRLQGRYRVFNYKKLLLNPVSNQWKQGEIWWGKPKRKKGDEGNDNNDNS